MPSVANAKLIQLVITGEQFKARKDKKFKSTLFTEKELHTLKNNE
jgi:hypothetical protein